MENEHVRGSGKLKILERTLPHLKPIVERAVHDFKQECLKRGVNPHSSLVHSFDDTIAQAYVLAVPGRTTQERYNMSFMTFPGHALDDEIENFSGLEKGLPVRAKVFKDMMLRINNRPTTQYLIDAIISGALIHQSKTEQEQRQRLMDYREKILAQVKDPKLKKDLARLHPTLLAQFTHTSMAGFFGLEQGNKNPEDLGTLYDMYYSPILYNHDDGEERKHEGSRILYGTELCERKTGRIKDNAFIPMIDLFGKHVTRIPDNRTREHQTQRMLVYEAFKDCLSAKLQRRYKQNGK